MIALADVCGRRCVALERRRAELPRVWPNWRDSLSLSLSGGRCSSCVSFLGASAAALCAGPKCTPAVRREGAHRRRGALLGLSKAVRLRRELRDAGRRVGAAARAVRVARTFPQHAQAQRTARSSCAAPSDYPRRAELADDRPAPEASSQRSTSASRGPPGASLRGPGGRLFWQARATVPPAAGGRL